MQVQSEIDLNVFKKRVEKISRYAKMGDLLLERGPSGFNDSGARQSSMRLGGRVTRLEISSLAGGTADYEPWLQN